MPRIVQHLVTARRRGSALIALGLGALVLLAPSHLGAQAAAPPAAGSRIRFASAPGTRVIGRLVEWTADSIVLETPAGRRRYALGADTRVDLSVGTRTQRGRGARIGALIGLAAGVTLGLASGSDDPNQWFALTAGEKALGGGVLLGGTGALIGLLVGATHRVDRWEQVGP